MTNSATYPPLEKGQIVEVKESHWNGYETAKLIGKYGVVERNHSCDIVSVKIGDEVVACFRKELEEL